MRGFVTDQVHSMELVGCINVHNVAILWLGIWHHWHLLHYIPS